MHFKIYAGALVLIGALIGMLWMNEQKIQRLKSDNAELVDLSNARGDSLKTFRLANGQKATRTTVLDLSRRNANAVANDERIAWTKKFGHKPKQLEEAAKTDMVADATFTIQFDTIAKLRDPVIWLSNDSLYLQIRGRTLNVTRDGLEPKTLCPERTFDNHYEWFRIHGRVTADTLIVDLSVPVPLECVVIWERKKILGLRIGKKEWFKETTSANPHVTITKDEITRIGKKR